ncbi:MAG: hypothetical protein AAGJ69_07090 [Cyanobacteria bacterium J06559_1]
MQRTFYVSCTGICLIPGLMPVEALCEQVVSASALGKIPGI